MQVPTTGDAEDEFAPPETVKEKLLPPKLRDLRQKLNAKAKREPGFRFYSLYGHICRAQVLHAAWRQVRANRGAPGVDGVRIEQVDRSEESVTAFLAEIEDQLRTRTYRASPVRRVYIPKPNGKLRPLGIPVLRDRVVQTAVKLLLEPIFEADFMDCSHGFRPGRSPGDALRQIQQQLQEQRTQVYDADLSSYFDTIPHDKLMACVENRVADGSILRLIRQWLRAPVVEPSSLGGPPTVQRHKEGTPQGGVISPLLANLYLHWFDRVFHRADGPRHFANARLVRYADDFVILARYIGPRITEFAEVKLEQWMGLKLNREKTRIVKVCTPGQTLDFLGYSFRYERDQYGRDRRWWRLFPSKKSLLKQGQWLREQIDSRHSWEPAPALIDRVNRHFRSWKGYFALGHPRPCLRRLDHQLRDRLSRHLQRRSQRPYRKPAHVSWSAHLQQLGLVPL